MTCELAKELKAAGFPQPEPSFGQSWYDKMGICMIGGQFDHKLLRVFTDIGEGEFEPFFILGCLTFAPTLDDITPLLPQSFALEMWDGRPSCTNRDEAQQIRTFGETFAEAAAMMWLEFAGMRGYGAN